MLSMHPSQALARLRAGWRPGPSDIDAAELIEDWQLSAGEHGPYQLHGMLAGQSCVTGVLAIDVRDGWALVQDRLLVLGERAPEACLAVSAADVLQRACELFAPAPGDATALRAQARALAQRARRAGFDTAGYLLEMAALELDRAIGSR
jgi:hypothetical protein